MSVGGGALACWPGYRVVGLWRGGRGIARAGIRLKCVARETGLEIRKRGCAGLLCVFSASPHSVGRRGGGR